MKKLLKFVLLVAFVFGGWTLAASSLHVVRAPGSMLWGRVPLNIQLVPKTTLTFKETYIDTTKWSVADVDAHPAFVERLRQANKLELLPAPSETHASISTSSSHVSPFLAPVPAPDVTPQTPASETPKEKSIFDFGK